MRTPFALLTSAAILGCAATADQVQTRDLAEQVVTQAYPGMPAALTRRAVQDELQQLCSLRPDEKLTTDAAARIVTASRESVRYPPSGALIGDWKAGEKIVGNGVGSRIRGGRIEKAAENGGLCINCHALDPNEVNAGNLGPSLTGYGKQRGNSEAVAKYTYEKIYNAWMYFPCSNMPRLGHNGFLTPEQITHVVAYLVDPKSPVNR